MNKPYHCQYWKYSKGTTYTKDVVVYAVSESDALGQVLNYFTDSRGMDWEIEEITESKVRGIHIISEREDQDYW